MSPFRKLLKDANEYASEYDLMLIGRKRGEKLYVKMGYRYGKKMSVAETPWPAVIELFWVQELAHLDHAALMVVVQPRTNESTVVEATGRNLFRTLYA